MVISIIIPVLNEELYLPKLLTILASQTFKDFEVIVVDGKSTDNTVSEAKKFANILNLNIITAPHKGVSFQRNLGAKEAKSDLLLFLDADVSFRSDFLEKIIHEFDPNKFSIATVHSSSIDHNFIDSILNYLYEIYQELTKNFAPEVYGWMMLVKKVVHAKINGFDEKLYFSEDSDYVKKIVKTNGKFQILKSAKVYFSGRRVKKEGRLAFELKMIKYYFYRKIYDKYKAQEKITYQAGKFTKE